MDKQITEKTNELNLFQNLHSSGVANQFFERDFIYLNLTEIEYYKKWESEKIQKDIKIRNSIPFE